MDLDEEEDDDASSSLEGSQASGSRRAWVGAPAAMEGLSMASFKASANKTSKQCAPTWPHTLFVTKADGSCLLKPAFELAKVLLDLFCACFSCRKLFFSILCRYRVEFANS